jgi:hypothetical protein
MQGIDLLGGTTMRTFLMMVLAITVGGAMVPLMSQSQAWAAKEEGAMKSYRITLTWQGYRYEDHIRTTSTFAVKKWVEQRYPGATGVNIREE